VTPPVVLGVLETALYVQDLAASQAFYERVLGCVELMREGRLHALRIPGDQVLLLFAIGRSMNPTEAPGGRIPPHDGRGQLHLAFEIARGKSVRGERAFAISKSRLRVKWNVLAEATAFTSETRTITSSSWSAEIAGI
jgi:catechol 2,3-dioxygenase-like lactoylglutathione lyase family enzyme